MSEKESAWSKMSKLDPRILYWLLIAVITISILVPFSFPMTVDKLVVSSYETIESLQEGDAVIIASDMEFAGKSEVGPAYIAMMKHLMRKGVKIVIWSTGLQSPLLTDSFIFKGGHLDFVKYGYEYGVDYVNLGYIPGEEIAVTALTTSISANFKSDYYGTPFEELELMENLEIAEDFKVVVCGAPLHYIRHWQPLGVEVISICSGLTKTEFLPFFDAGQLSGMIAGQPGSAMYEYKTHEPDFALANVRPMIMAHLLLVLLLVIGNISYVMERLT